MQTIPMVVNSLHVLSGVFWAGSTFALARARAGSDLAVQLFRPQMAAAVVAVLTGGYLWRTLHEGGMSVAERILGGGVVCAILAVLVQGVVAGVAIRGLRKGSIDDDTARSSLKLAHRSSAALLALTVVAMAGARFA